MVILNHYSYFVCHDHFKFLLVILHYIVVIFHLFVVVLYLLVVILHLCVADLCPVVLFLF